MSQVGALDLGYVMKEGMRVFDDDEWDQHFALFPKPHEPTA